MPVVDGLPVSVVRGYVTPWQPAASPPEHAVDHRAVIGPTAAPLRLLTGQQGLKPGPFLIGQIVSIQHTDGLPQPAVKIRGTRSNPRSSRPPARRSSWLAAAYPPSTRPLPLQHSTEDIANAGAIRCAA